MSIDDICNLDVGKICSDECALFLWTTGPHLQNAFKVIESWGFEYKTLGFVWVKQNKSGNGFFTGMGYYTRANAEICLLCNRKGKKLPRVVSHSIKQVVMSPVEEHSKKPDDVADRIVDLFGNIPRIELFARHKRKGWHSWGNEVSNNVQLLIKGA